MSKSNWRAAKVTRINTNAGHGWLAPIDMPHESIFFNYRALETPDKTFPEPGAIVEFLPDPFTLNMAAKVHKKDG